MKAEMTLDEYRAFLKAQGERYKPPADDREHREQAALFEWAALHESRAPELALLFAIPNGGARHPAVAAKLKAEGVKAGVPDVFLPVPRDEWHGLVIEMKAEGGTTSSEQDQWLYALGEQGYLTTTCWGWVAAAKRVTSYLGYRLEDLGL